MNRDLNYYDGGDKPNPHEEPDNTHTHEIRDLVSRSLPGFELPHEQPEPEPVPEQQKEKIQRVITLYAPNTPHSDNSDNSDNSDVSDVSDVSDGGVGRESGPIPTNPTFPPRVLSQDGDEEFFPTPSAASASAIIETQASERIHPTPHHSILYDFLLVSRSISEAPECFSVAPVLGLCSYLLTPSTWWNFAGRKYPNLFQFVVGPPALKKSTSFLLTERIAGAILSPRHFHRGNTSDSALFEKFERNPHRLQIQGEANPVISYWAGSTPGKDVANRYLDLYDGSSWTQTFKHQKGEAAESTSERHIELATLSLVLGGTFNCSRFSGVDARSGLRRRFGYYVADQPARTIIWPDEISEDLVGRFAESFDRLTQVEGAFFLEEEAKKLWAELQVANREKLLAIQDIDEASEAQRYSLGEEPARILKLAGIFQACIWAKKGTGNPLAVTAETLRTAWDHQLACNEAGVELDRITQRRKINDEGDRILAAIRSEIHLQVNWVRKGNRVELTKTQLTNKFASHRGSRQMNPSYLYGTILPGLIARGDATMRKEGSTTVYAFRLE